MGCKLTTLVLVGCCVTTVVSARPQTTRSGVSVIVVPTEDVASQLRSRIREGTSFEALATTYSIDSTAPRAGYLGVVDHSTLRQEFRVALAGLKPGAVSPVTRVGDTFVLLKRTTEDEDAWRLKQDNAQAVLKEGRYLEAVSLFDSAVEQAGKLGANDIRLAESLNGLAQAYRFRQNYSDAEPRARRSLAILETTLGNAHDGLLPSLACMAAIMQGRGNYAEAEQVYRRILAIRWGTPGVDNRPARDTLENFAEVLTLVHTRDRHLDRALDTFWRSFGESHLRRETLLGMLDNLMSLQLVEAAESLMQRSIRLHPDSRQLRYRFGELYVTWGKYERAIELFEEAARLGVNGGSGADRLQRGRIHGRIGEMNFRLVRFDDAVQALTTALELNPGDTSARLLLGAIYVRRSKFEEAAAEYRRVIAIDSRNAPAHDGLAQVALSLGHYRESALEADAALAIDPTLQTSRYNKAMALIRSGRDEGKAALEEYQEYEAKLNSDQANQIEVAGFDRTALNLLAEGRPQKAIEALREGIRTHPLSGILYLKLGLLQSQLRLHKEAVDTFETMTRLKVDDFLVHRQLAREYELLGNREKSQLQRVLYLQRYDLALQSNLN